MALDEPTVALDRQGLAMLDTAVRQAAAEGAAVVLVTHDLAYARSVAHRLVRLDAGRLHRMWAASLTFSFGQITRFEGVI